MRSRIVASIAFALLFAAFVVGCEAGTCTRHSDCPASFICGQDGRCITAPTPTPSDAGGGSDTDGGTLDASTG